MLQNSGSVTPRINPPLSPAEREQRYRRVLRRQLRRPGRYYNIKDNRQNGQRAFEARVSLAR
jgi:hypothetical protein